MISLHHIAASQKIRCCLCRKLYPDLGCTVDKSLLEFRGRCSFKQHIPNKPSKYGIKVYVLADSKSFYSVGSKIYAVAGTHIQNVSGTHPSGYGFDSDISGTNRNITTDNYYTSISIAENAQANNLTLVSTIKKNKRCIPRDFLTKADPGTVQNTFDHAKDFTLLSTAPKGNKGVLFCLQCTHCHAIMRMLEKKK